MRGKRVIDVAPGNRHTVVATDAGEVLTFGRGPTGCLGHGGTGDELLPRVVDLERDDDEEEDDSDAANDDDEEEEEHDDY